MNFTKILEERELSNYQIDDEIIKLKKRSNAHTGKFLSMGTPTNFGSKMFFGTKKFKWDMDQDITQLSDDEIPEEN
jgi:hypothetical protein